MRRLYKEGLKGRALKVVWHRMVLFLSRVGLLTSLDVKRLTVVTVWTVASWALRCTSGKIGLGKDKFLN